MFAAVDEQNAQTQQQVFSLSRAEEEGLVEEDEEEDAEEDKTSLHSSYSSKHRGARRGQKHPKRAFPTGRPPHAHALFSVFSQ